MQKIVDALETLNLTQAALAAKLGVHQTTISRFKTGDLPLDKRTQLALDALLTAATSAKPARKPTRKSQAMTQ